MKVISNILFEGTYTLDDLQAAVDAARAEGGNTVVSLAINGYEHLTAELEFITTIRPFTEAEIDAELTLPEYLAKHGRDS